MEVGRTIGRRRTLSSRFCSPVLRSSSPSGSARRTLTPCPRAQVTLDQETGDQLIRYTFEAITESGTVSAIYLTFPDGFDVKKSSVDIVNSQGLNRINVPYTSHQDRPNRAHGVHQAACRQH